MLTFSSFWKEVARRGSHPLRASPATAESQSGHPDGSVGAERIRPRRRCSGGAGTRKRSSSFSPPTVAAETERAPQGLKTSQAESLPRRHPIPHVVRERPAVTGSPACGSGRAFVGYPVTAGG